MFSSWTLHSIFKKIFAMFLLYSDNLQATERIVHAHTKLFIPIQRVDVMCSVNEMYYK